MSFEVDTMEKLFNNTENKQEDNVNHPSHYTFGKIEVMDYIEDKLSDVECEGYFVGNIIKYVSRFRKKNGIEDLKKAQWYLNRLISNMEGKNE